MDIFRMPRWIAHRLSTLLTLLHQTGATALLSKTLKSAKKYEKWRDIQPGTYKVLETHNYGCNKYGHSVVLKLEHKNGPTFFVWAPFSLFYAMEKRKCTNFILNLGAKISEETGGIFYDFKLC